MGRFHNLKDLREARPKNAHKDISLIMKRTNFRFGFRPELSNTRV